MAQNKYLQGPCSHCGKIIRYPAQMAGTSSTCPTCGQVTDLVLEEPRIEAGGISRRTVIWTIVTIFVLVLGLIGAFIALKSARNLRENRQKKAEVVVSPTRVWLSATAPLGRSVDSAAVPCAEPPAIGQTATS